jgi:HEAT repeat protein
VLEALGQLGDKRAVPPVAAKLTDSDPEVRQRAVATLAELGDESVIEKLVLAIVDEHSGVRQAAARALTEVDPGWYRSEQVQQLLPTLRAALKHRDAGVQYAASTLLRQITGLGPVEAAASSPQPHPPQAQPAAIEILCALLGDADAEVRLAAAESLGRLRSPAASEALKAAAKDSVSWVQAAAREALAALSPAAP